MDRDRLPRKNKINDLFDIAIFSSEKISDIDIEPFQEDKLSISFMVDKEE